MPIRTIPINQSFRLSGEEGEYRTVMRDARIRQGVTEVYIAPYMGGRLFTDRGRWIDWDTEVTVVTD